MAAMVRTIPRPPMTPRTDHAIVYALRTPHNRRSAVTFAGRFAIVPATVLLGGAVPRKLGERLTAALHSGQFVNVHEGDDDVDDVAAGAGQWPELRALELRVVHESTASGGGDMLQHSDASVRYVFDCANVGDAIARLLDGFESTDCGAVLTKDRPSGANDFSLGQCALSAFVVLEIRSRPANANQPELSLEDMLQMSAGRDKWANVIAMHACQRLDRVATVTTPFANEVFFKSLNVGSVANRFGVNDCLLVVSQALVAGCEGGAVYNEQLELVGIVISTQFRWKRYENASMTLVASFAEILRTFLCQWQRCPWLRVEQCARTFGESSSSSCGAVDKCLILIEVGSSSGTGFFLRVKGQRFIVTCAHVVLNAKSNTSPISCTWSGGRFSTTLLYSNPQHGAAYDIALLHVPDSAVIPDSTFAPPASHAPRLSDRVLAAGFPHFCALARGEHGWAPSLLEGRLMRVAAHMLVSDASVQAGQSGGPLLSVAGAVVAVMVSNTRETTDGQIYPHVNMCVPIDRVVGVLEAYVRTGDVAELDGLRASAPVQRAWQLQPDMIISKL